MSAPPRKASPNVEKLPACNAASGFAGAQAASPGRRPVPSVHSWLARPWGLEGIGRAHKIRPNRRKQVCAAFEWPGVSGSERTKVSFIVDSRGRSSAMVRPAVRELAMPGAGCCQRAVNVLPAASTVEGFAPAGGPAEAHISVSCGTSCRKDRATTPQAFAATGRSRRPS